MKMEQIFAKLEDGRVGLLVGDCGLEEIAMIFYHDPIHGNIISGYGTVVGFETKIIDITENGDWIEIFNCY